MTGQDAGTLFKTFTDVINELTEVIGSKREDMKSTSSGCFVHPFNNVGSVYSEPLLL